MKVSFFSGRYSKNTSIQTTNDSTLKYVNQRITKVKREIDKLIIETSTPHSQKIIHK